MDWSESLMRISVDLHPLFIEAVEELKRDYGRRFTYLNGFGSTQINYTEFIDRFTKEETVADATIDGSANTGVRDICSMLNEMSKPQTKMLGFNKIFYEMQKLYGLEVAKEWLRNEWSGAFYLHDAPSTTFMPYCYAYDLEELAEKGLYFVAHFNGGAPQHLATFIDFVGEFISYVSNRTSGACGLPSFLVYAYYFWRKDVASGHYAKTPEYHMRQEFQRIIYKLNQPYLRVTQSAFTNFSIFDRPYFQELFGGKKFPDGSYIIDAQEEFMDFQKIFMEVCSEIRSVNMMTFPVITYSLLFQDGDYVDQDMAQWACRHNMQWNDANFFNSESVTSLSNCCRLLSDIKDLGYFNSIGGSALRVGSVKVNTVNLARIAYETGGDEQEFFDLLTQRVTNCCQALHAIRGIIARNIVKGLLPNYTKGLVTLDTQYNTVGIIGVYETLKHLGYVVVDEFGNHSYTLAGVEFAESILHHITMVKDDFIADCEHDYNMNPYSINIEVAPAERAAAILMEKDKILHPNGCFDLPLYGNQWIPLGIQSTLQEKISLSAILDKACSGGSIAHINLDAPLTDFDTAWKLLNHIANEGVTYFAFCTRISACAHNHGFYGETCPHCGGPKKTTYQRIVGFLVPEITYSKERKAEFQLRRWLGEEELI